jgi:LmbE family N-acetylglucosaminyl deacetylase
MDGMDEPAAPLSGPVLGVWAHPDDEAYLSAGLMSAAIRAGHNVTCVTATKGELGTPTPDEWPPARLALRRTHEMAAAMAVLGVKDHRFLGYYDGHCEAADQELATSRIAEILAAAKPATIVTFGPDGMTGHPDHIAVSNWTTAAWKSLGCPGQLLYARLTPEVHRRHIDDFQRYEIFPPGLPVVAAPPDEIVELRLSDTESDRKLTMLACHSSQTRPLFDVLGESLIESMWGIETFVTAASQPSPPEDKPLLAAY